MRLKRMVKFNFIATLDGQKIKSTIKIEKSDLKGMDKYQIEGFVRDCVYEYINSYIKVDIL